MIWFILLHMLPATSFLSRGHCSQQFNCCELIWHQAGMMTWENVRYEDNIVGYQLYYSELFLEEHVLYNPAVHPPWQKSALLLLFL